MEKFEVGAVVRNKLCPTIISRVKRIFGDGIFLAECATNKLGIVGICGIMDYWEIVK